MRTTYHLLSMALHNACINHTFVHYCTCTASCTLYMYPHVLYTLCMCTVHVADIDHIVDFVCFGTPCRKASTLLPSVGGWTMSPEHSEPVPAMMCLAPPIHFAHRAHWITHLNSNYKVMSRPQCIQLKCIEPDALLCWYLYNNLLTTDLLCAVG